MYTNLAELLLEFTPEELAQLTGDPSGVNINQARIDYAIENASNLIDNFLRNRYEVPFSPIPSLIKFIAREIAICNIYEYANHDSFVPPTITKRKSYAMYLLYQIQNGRLQLEIVPNRTTILINKENEKRLFDDDMLEKFTEV
ncbi:MAG: phage protein Gp36 family protein [Candidatus Kapaibacteriota bacterium]